MVVHKKIDSGGHRVVKAIQKKEARGRPKSLRFRSGFSVGGRGEGKTDYRRTLLSTGGHLTTKALNGRAPK